MEKNGFIILVSKKTSLDILGLLCRIEEINTYTYTWHRRPFGKPIPVWVYICEKSVFSVKSSCALVTREEITISPRARTSCPGRNYHFLPGDECARRFHGKKLKRYRNLSTAIAYIDSYRNKIFLMAKAGDLGFSRILQDFQFELLSIKQPTSSILYHSNANLFLVWDRNCLGGKLRINWLYRVVRE